MEQNTGVPERERSHLIGATLLLCLFGMFCLWWFIRTFLAQIALAFGVTMALGFFVVVLVYARKRRLVPPLEEAQPHQESYASYREGYRGEECTARYAGETYE